MKHINTIIVDDEPLAREVIETYLQNFNQIKVLGVAENGEKAMAMINELKPDLIFLDIEMPKMDGISLLEHSDLLHHPLVIFTTAYDQYAITAFELNAVDYLLKPFDRSRFSVTMEKALDKIKWLDKEHLELQFRQFNNDYTESSNKKKVANYPRKLVVRDSKRIKHIEVSNIIHIKGAGDYIEIHEANNCFTLYKKLADIELRLDPDKFRRIHKSSILNCDMISEIRPHINGEYHFHMVNKIIIKSGRTYKDRLVDLVQGNL